MRKLSMKSRFANSLKQMLFSLRQLSPYLTPHKKALSLVVVAMLVTTIISISTGFGLRYVADAFSEEMLVAPDFLNKVLLIVITLLVIYSLLNFLSSFLLKKVSAKITEHIRRDAFENIINQDLEYIEKQTSGELQTRLVADTNAVGRFLTTQVTSIFSAFLSLFGGIIGCLFISPKLTLIVVVCAPVIFLPYLFCGKHLRHLGAMLQASISDVGRFAGETFRNTKVMKAYNGELEAEQNFAAFTANVTDYSIRGMRLSLLLETFVGFMATSAAIVLIWYSTKSILTGDMTLGQLVAFAYFSRLIVSAVSQFAGVATSINIILGKAKKVITFLTKESYSWPSLITDFKVKGNIDFNKVIFSYPNRPDTSVLKGVNLNIKAGTHVAIVGASGAGKSTLFDLLLRFYEPQEGKILIDGIDIRDLGTECLRGAIGYVPQSEHLASYTIRENIAYGRPGLDHEKITEAAKKAHAHEFIQRLPQGYDTKIGEIEARLSGGQKQRISLARAFACDPQMLMLDEVNSALDAENDYHVYAAIDEWAKAGNKTVLSIAHRINTAHKADIIVVMEAGFIVGVGTHKELLNTCNVYQTLSQNNVKKIPKDTKLEAAC